MRFSVKVLARFLAMAPIIAVPKIGADFFSTSLISGAKKQSGEEGKTVGRRGKWLSARYDWEITRGLKMGKTWEAVAVTVTGMDGHPRRA